MKNFYWFKQIANNNSKSGRSLSLGEFKRAVSWSKYLVSSGAAIKGEGEEQWSADMSQLYIGNKFASGRHSRIYRGLYKQRDVAIKLISQPEEDESLASWLEKQFTSEVALLFRLQHPNIIAFVGACKKPPVFCIITEYLAGGSLRKYLHQQDPYSIPLNLVLKLALDIGRGMQYLHSKGIIHRDLKSENLLLGEDMCVKVADFGISCLESQCGSAKGFTGTYRWMAPEMIKEKRHTKKVDVYSFGIVLWELLTALIPFNNMTPEQAAFAVSQKDLIISSTDAGQEIQINGLILMRLYQFWRVLQSLLNRILVFSHPTNLQRVPIFFIACQSVSPPIACKQVCFFRSLRIYLK
ncbi:serine/threonine/tyrosine-protein kinase HT1-like isoform X1 [Malania oleifera]|uniref:serine/threonine/tyrosine-protein kinase HT1-like isoform X1 n=1 Tax=Malania oleifera TaxID=397392 RepID=UPI0025AE0F62|nr:serine/threonine/tyrosine-protein kinase HT1-like isoform X1 [Malania oleifera]